MDAKLTVSFIVTYNFKWIDAAIASLQYTTTPHEIYVVINGATQNEAEQFKTTYPNIKTIQNEHPLSFSENHNIMMRQSQTPYIALLNDDIEVHEDALDILVAYLDEHPEAGLVGPQLYYEDGTPQTSAYSDPGLLRMIYKISGLARLTHQRSPLRRWLLRMGLGKLMRLDSLRTIDTPQTVDVVKGAVMLVRREAYLQGGLMDENMKAYAEELDWQYRLRQVGWKMVLVPQARVTHFGLGQAELTLKGERLYFDRVGILTYYIKHRSTWQTAIIRATILLSHGFWGVVWLPFERARATIHFKTAKMALTWRYQTRD